MQRNTPASWIESPAQCCNTKNENENENRIDRCQPLFGAFYLCVTKWKYYCTVFGICRMTDVRQYTFTVFLLLMTFHSRTHWNMWPKEATHTQTHSYGHKEREKTDWQKHYKTIWPNRLNSMAMAWICGPTKKVFTLIKVRRQSSTIYAHVRINSFYIAFSFNQMFFRSLSPVSSSPALALCLRLHLTIFMMNFNLMAPIAFA